MSHNGHQTRFALFCAAAAVSLTLAGCATYHPAASNGFSGKRLADAGAAAGILVQVDGKVGGAQGAMLATAVTAALPATVAGAAVHYVACEPYTECPGDHLVFTFGPPAARPANAYPLSLATNINWLGYHPAANNVTAKLTLFQGGMPVSSISGQTDANGPDDPAFRSLIASMSQSVLSGPDAFDWVGFP